VGRVLTADRMNAYNTFEHGDAVKPEPFHGGSLRGGVTTLVLPPKSVVVGEIR
jgi:alpha-N-arabinofuranosidase